MNRVAIVTVLLCLVASTASTSLPAADAATKTASQPPATTPAASARATVERLHTALLEAMHHPGRERFAERSALLAPVIEASFDFKTIARIVLGREWSRLDEAKRRRFLETFRRLSVATYASRFDSWNGERFEVLEETAASRPGYRIVRTRLVEADGDTVALDYMLRRTAAGWRIVNVVADGVSDLSLKRADYRAVIASAGIDGLLEKLERQIAGYASGGEA